MDIISATQNFIQIKWKWVNFLSYATKYKMKSRITTRWSKHFYTYLCKLDKIWLWHALRHPIPWKVLYSSHQFSQNILLRRRERWMFFFLSFYLFKKHYCKVQHNLIFYLHWFCWVLYNSTFNIAKQCWMISVKFPTHLSYSFFINSSWRS